MIDTFDLQRGYPALGIVSVSGTLIRRREGDGVAAEAQVGGLRAADRRRCSAS
jgi:hypothetical protein